ncbi:hypothetical protein [Methyloceanibacter caenitepidi]|uniref:Uncharacterized protein n=1 Tax=Methyloceanibacter caenitepidi TaxID=1384459 RepID=A0A0A8K0Q3_9HYPH|nr:hypothetical protein [Methyloceanibacter caenitepidi]BAQ16087.1 hypothetical protein GL4_0624 [Methyloceanibacter caenitepidi]
MKIPAHMIQPGDLVDLEGDAFADPLSNNPFYRCELAACTGATPALGYVALAFGHDGIFVPADHILNVKGHVSA